MPDIWPIKPTNEFLGSRLCSVTGVSYSVGGAYIIPQEELEWYKGNSMAIYGGDIDNAANILPLRNDLRECFDDGWFVIAPKITPDGVQCVTHILSDMAAELWPTYQNIVAQHLPKGSKIYLFARFAWAILQRVKLFVSTGVNRQVLRVHFDDKTGTAEYKDEYIKGPQLNLLYGGSRHPAKRKHQQFCAEFEDNFSEGLSSESDWI